MAAIGLAGQKARTLKNGHHNGNSGQGIIADKVPAIPLVGYNIFVLKGAEEYLRATSEFRRPAVRRAYEARDTRGGLKQ
jgi:hypothetical protein